MEGEIKNLINVWLSVIASLCYCYFICSKVPKGKYRFISLLPIFYLFTILPLYLSYAFPISITAFFITWLANFKLLLFCFDQGPLSWVPQKSLLLFIVTASLPIKIKQQNYKNDPKPPKLPLNLGTESFLFSVLMGVLYSYRERIHQKIVLVVYCCLVFLLVDLLIALSSAMVRVLIGLELEPPSDEPYFATSLQDFWGRRWNLMVTNILRHTVYKPVRSASAALLGREWAPLPAVLAAFLVSGLMHELLFYYVTRATPTWEMTLFFVLHGVCVVVEFRVKRALTDRWRLHWAVSGPLTVGFVMVTSFWLFFPPLTRNGADVRVIEEFQLFLKFMKRPMKLQSFVG
uniref:Putative long-chain-alcohol O-fatty-acyltransferase 5 n=1 Tax=Davidia involucrata TaxID=16924 RepID=A0A5B7BKD6_DAVIN